MLVHECAPEIDEGRKFACACAQKISSHDARGLVAARVARWKLQLMIGGRLVPGTSEVILVVRRYRLNARMVTATDIVNAYTGEDERGRRERDRIEVFGTWKDEVADGRPD